MCVGIDQLVIYMRDLIVVIDQKRYYQNDLNGNVTHLKLMYYKSTMVDKELIQYMYQKKAGSEPQHTITFTIDKRQAEKLNRDFPNISMGRTAKQIFLKEFKNL